MLQRGKTLITGFYRRGNGKGSCMCISIPFSRFDDSYHKYYVYVCCDLFEIIKTLWIFFGHPWLIINR